MGVEKKSVTEMEKTLEQ